MLVSDKKFINLVYMYIDRHESFTLFLFTFDGPIDWLVES